MERLMCARLRLLGSTFGSALLLGCVHVPGAVSPAPVVTAESAARTAAAVALIGNVQADAARDIPPDQQRPASGERPQLDAATAARMDVADYLAQGPSPWLPDPQLGATLAARRADFTVALDGNGSHRSLQAAIDAVPLRTVNAARVHIELKPGVYRERVCVPADKAPISLRGDAADTSAVIIVGSAYGGQAKRAGVDIAHPCQPDLALPIVGTFGSATLVVAADDFQAAHLTVANDALEHVRLGVGYPAGASESGGAQGVALTVQADRVQLQHVRLIGHQDTLLVRRPRPDAAARVYVHDSLIAGDVDFIFGNGTLVVEGSTILNRGNRRRPPNGGHVLAPSTPAGVKLGFLVTRSRFLAEPGTPLANISLGRAWDEGVPRGQWQPGNSPNGQALIRDSLLGPHLALQAPWAASTSRRPFTASGPQAARMAEFNNTVLGGDPLAREVLSPWDGWAAAAGGVIGGATAAEADVHTVHNRQELVRALQPHARPRIVRVQGRIDLSTDDSGRPLGFEDYRDPAFSWAAFAAAYDPATWGRRKPEGPLEEARQRSARRQAERVVLKLPSHTTVIGVGTDAHIVNGGLLVDQARQVIVRNLRFSDAYDQFPAWDPNDNAGGEWNAEYDNLSLRGATQVWVDHCSFDDGDRPDRLEAVLLGRRMQRHDGLLDITQASNHVTVSWNRFRQHDKSVLVGSGDNRTADDGKLKVSFHHNLWEQLSERTPRVRFGQVHVYNNLFVVQEAGPYPYGYSLGIGIQSRLISERNVWETPASVPPDRLARVFKGQVVADRGSLHNGQPLQLLAALRARHPGLQLHADPGWTPVLFAPLDPVSEVPARVRAGAGAGRLGTPLAIPP
jgi:pectin methylesterase-like acyl-CoA thioesterase/pectate lyase